MSINPAALIEIIGVHGEEWTVSGPGMGDQGVMLSADPEGLFDEAPWNGIWQQGATQEGATLLGVATDPIDITLNFETFTTDDGMPWAEVDARFFASFDKIKEATIRVTDQGETRTLRVVKMSEARLKAKKDPRITGHAVTTLSLRAAWPYWEGDTVTSTYVAPAGGGTHTGAIILSNPTDVPCFPQWSLSAPGKWTIPDAHFDDEDGPSRLIVLPTLASGQDLTIDTYPTEETYITADGSNYAGRMGGVDFLHPIPDRTPPTELPVSFTGSAGGVAQARMVRYWKRPFGKAYF